MKNKHLTKILFVILTLLLAGCAEQSCPELPTAAPTSSPVPTQTAVPTQSNMQVFTTTTLYNLEYKSDYNAIPNLVSRITADYISIYPFNAIYDYVYDTDNSVWVVGSFGIIHETVDGEQTWYSIKNGLAKQFFTAIAISPEGVVWVGGTEKALYWFDGEQWVSEGEKLPVSLDEKYWDWGSRIEGIDFAPDGSTWVVSSETEIYAQKYGSWVNIPFENAPLSLNGANYPIGLLVQSEKDITILVTGTFEKEPSAFHFDGESWERNSDAASAVVDLINSRRHSSEPGRYLGYSFYITNSNLLDHWPMDEDSILFASYTKYLLATSSDGSVWLWNDWFPNLYNNSSGTFKDLSRSEKNSMVYGSPSGTALDFSESILLDFGSQLLYYQEERWPKVLDAIENERGEIIGPDYFVDEDERVWFYLPERGLNLVDQGKSQIVSEIPDNVKGDEVGGTYVFEDGRVWIGGKGEIWEYQDGDWQRWVFSKVNEVFEYFAEDSSGNVYAAAGGTVYIIEGRKYSYAFGLKQNEKPVVLPADGKFGDCTSHPYFKDSPECKGIIIENTKFHYEPVYLKMLEDGSLIYINNRVIAKLEDGEWKSFYFGDFEIFSATVDLEGDIWIYSESDGLFRIDGDCFEAFKDVEYP